MKRIMLFAFLTLTVNCLFSQTFTEQTGINLTNIIWGASAWGDYDNDGDLDILLTGHAGASGPISKIYRNNGNSSFSEQTAISLSGVERSSVAWGDYDNDGYLDILLTGITTGSTRISKIYKNNGNNTFTEQTEISLIGVQNGSVAWGDYDNDGDLDILLTGYYWNTDASISRVYQNNGNNTFTWQKMISLPGVSGSSVAWGDYDNDGYLDILLAGESGSSRISKIYRNNGNNSFTEQTGISLPGIDNSSVAWGDYDNDGDLDILLTGSGTGNNSKIYRNNGNNTFTELTGISIPVVNNSSASWGDYDNDGDLDILLAGESGSSRISKIYRNNGNNTFTEQAEISLSGIYYGSATWGDYDNDGDLDILLTGNSTCKIYRNEGSVINTCPLSPSCLMPIVNKDSVTLSWKKATDAQTPSDGLTYNLHIKKVSDGFMVISPMSDLFTGFRRIPKSGNMNHALKYTAKNLDGGEYEWYIQAVDNCFSGSVFTKGQNFRIAPRAPTKLEGIATSTSEINLTWVDNSKGETGYIVERSIGNNQNFSPVASLNSNITSFSDNGLTPETLYYYRVKAKYNDLSSEYSNEINVTTSIFIVQTGISLTGVCNSSVAWGDYDNDGDLDVLLTGQAGTSNHISKIYRNNGNNTFTDQTDISLTGVYDSSVAWGDYDNDGDLDIILTGHTGSSRISKIYRNSGNNTFTEQIGISLTGVSSSSVAWGDYDNDGDLDIILTGDTGSNRISKIYRNNGNNTFTEQTGISLTGVYSSSVAWGDYDNDGDLDILLTGYTGTTRISKVYKNNGNNTFTEQTGISLTGVTSGSVAWGDYDNDGDLDILLTGQGTSNYISKIYKNNNDNTFTDQTEILLSGVYNSSVNWGDCDNDGDLDILLTGKTISSNNSISRIFKNVGNNTFTEQIGISLTGVYISSTAWGDYDNDGDLDILLTGSTSSSTRISKIYKNEGSKANTVPSFPSNLKQTVSNSNVTFTWDKATDKETPPNGLSYNLVVQSNDGKIRKGPLSDINNGIRKVVGIGNVGQNNSWTIKDLQDGIYSWSVQTIDHNYAGSPFAPSGIFGVGTPITIDKPIAPDGTANLCLNPSSSEYTTSSVPGATSYCWSITPSNAGVITGDSITVMVDWSNTFSGTAKIAVIAQNDLLKSESSDSLTVVINTPPSSTGAISGDQTVCQGTDHWYKTIPIAGADSYIWSLPEGASGTSNTDSIVVSFSSNANSGNIKVNGINNCGTGSESFFAVKINSLPSQSGIISGSQTVCQGTSGNIYKTRPVSGADSYIWSLPQGAIGASKSDSINVNFDLSAISGEIKIKGQNSCGTGVESSFAVTVNPKPEKPLVSKSGFTLKSNAENGNQWYKQDALIPGANQQEFTSTGDGNYYVIVTEEGCSSDPSDAFIVTDIETISSMGMVEVYPNPVAKNLTIVPVNNNVITYEFIDLLGKLIQKGSISGKTVIETGSFLPGIYLLKINNGKTTEFIKISKE